MRYWGNDIYSSTWIENQLKTLVSELNEINENVRKR